MGFVEQFLAFWLPVFVSEFFLNVLDLLLEEIFALLFVEVFPGFRTYVLLELQELKLTVYYLEHGEHPVFD